MAKTKRIQVLMEPDEFEAFEQIARKMSTSISELMRQTARTYLLIPHAATRRAEAAKRFLDRPDVAMPPWQHLKAEIEARRG